MSLPSGGITNHFGDLTETIYSNFEQNAANVVDAIYNELITGTPISTGTGTPVYTGALKANWETGIRPNSKVKYKRPKNVNIKNPRVFPNPERKVGKRYGIHNRYYIWNNTTYLVYVNAGINPRVGSDNQKVIKGIGFVGKAIAIGVKNAATFGKIKEMKFF